MRNRQGLVNFWKTTNFTRPTGSCIFFLNFEKFNLLVFTSWNCTGSKQLLDEVFLISRLTKVEVGFISLSLRLRLITLTETLITLDITKTESNNCFIIHWTKNKNKKKWKSSFCFFTDGKQHKARELDMITPRNHAPRSYMTWLPVTLSVLDMIIA